LAVTWNAVANAILSITSLSGMRAPAM
jgi:hypothetical protein